MAVGAPLLTEEDLLAVRALVDAHLAAVSLGGLGIAARIWVVMVRWR